MPLRLIIADDHPLLVDGLKSVLEEIKSIQVLESVNSGRELIDRLQKSVVDIVVLDLNMPQLDGLEVLKILKTQFPSVKTIVLTSYNQPELIKEIKALGAKGFLLKSSPSTMLKEAVIAVAAGKEWVTNELPKLQSSDYFMDDFMKKYQLTRREVEIIRLIAAGFTSKEIAEKIFVSEFTINAHRRNISRKLNIRNSVGLLQFAKEQGLI
jgi:DNA-binding NarL/FixJ family response regulator